MQETIYSIPISDVFEKNDGCPLCQLRAVFEERAISFLLDGGLMESAVRARTNTLGFCSHHLETLLEGRNKLGLALMLSSHLSEIERLFREPGDGRRHPFRKRGESALHEKIDSMVKSCFICDEIFGSEEKCLNNTVFLWHSSPEFRLSFQKADICLAHSSGLLSAAQNQLRAATQEEFINDIREIVLRTCGDLIKGLDGFAGSFDYRSTGALAENERDALLNTLRFLNSL